MFNPLILSACGKRLNTKISMSLALMIRGISEDSSKEANQLERDTFPVWRISLSGTLNDCCCWKENVLDSKLV